MRYTLTIQPELLSALRCVLQAIRENHPDCVNPVRFEYDRDAWGYNCCGKCLSCCAKILESTFFPRVSFEMGSVSQDQENRLRKTEKEI